MTENLLQNYRLEEEAGRGRFGIIKKCFHKQTGEEVACKSIRKAELEDSLDRQSVSNEIKILEYIAGGHPGVIGVHEVYEDNEFVHVVMDMCSGGDLFEKIVERRTRFSEEEVATFLHKLMDVVRYCHSLGVAHRDLKPDNILFVNRDHSFSQIKLVDFGQASFFSQGGRMEGVVGTPYYVAPEVLTQSYHNEKVDVWSAGVIGYIMLSGILPFRGETPQQIFEAVIHGRLRFPTDPWLSVSSSAKDLMRRMLSRDVEKRFTVTQVLGTNIPGLPVIPWQKPSDLSVATAVPPKSSSAFFTILEEDEARRLYIFETIHAPNVKKPCKFRDYLQLVSDNLSFRIKCRTNGLERGRLLSK